MTKATPHPHPKPFSKEELIDRIIRVDHAGEYGAVRIYQGQLAVLGKHHPMTPIVQHMKEQEDVHLERFNALIRKRQIRPTLMTPFWHVAGFALGAGTALLGEKAAMACTEAVETVIDDHYRDQIKALGEDESALSQELEKFRQEEVDHKNTATEHGAKEAAGYELLSGLIRFGCKAAIKISERL
ncbi:MAG: demethoxyubiquinone hydroxylase family protein [Emcibacter sp.]|nr:demethoxyubiquinone hydroxylase family protein [Emcibacter sp.]